MNKIRPYLISMFVVLWLGVFFYETTRAFYLNPFFKRELPKIKFLFPPAGWIMFFNVDDTYGYAQVYGVKGADTQPIDPHQILLTRAIGYDNIHRNALVGVLDQRSSAGFCRYLGRKFPYFERFIITYVQYPSVTQRPFEKLQQVVYTCP